MKREKRTSLYDTVFSVLNIVYFERRYPFRKSVITPSGKALLGLLERRHYSLWKSVIAAFGKMLSRISEKPYYALLKGVISPYWMAWSCLLEKRCNAFFALLTERYNIFQLHKPYHEAFVINNPVSTRIFTSSEYFLQISKQIDRNLYRNWWDWRDPYH